MLGLKPPRSRCAGGSSERGRFSVGGGVYGDALALTRATNSVVTSAISTILPVQSAAHDATVPGRTGQPSDERGQARGERYVLQDRATPIGRSPGSSIGSWWPRDNVSSLSSALSATSDTRPVSTSVRLQLGTLLVRAKRLQGAQAITRNSLGSVAGSARGAIAWKQPRSEPLDGAEGTRYANAIVSGFSRERSRRLAGITASTATGVINFMPPAKRKCAANSPCIIWASRRALFVGELLELSCVSSLTHSQPFLADGPIRGSLTTCLSRARPARTSDLVDPCAYLISSADGAVTWDEDIDVVRHALEQSQRGEVVPDRSAALKSSIGIKTSESVSPATRTLRSSINSAAWPGACA